jgi:hypothetical protein
MPIPENILKQIKCCLYDDGHIVNDPVVLKCGANACKKCVSDSIDGKIKCYFCNGQHEKNDLMNAPNNKMVESVITLFLDDLFQDLNKKLESTLVLFKGMSLFLVTLLH